MRWLAIFVAGCSFHAGSASDAPIADAPDAPIGSEQPAATCWQRWHDHTIAFHTPGIVQELASQPGASDKDMSLSGDELTIYFSTNRAIAPAGFDMYVATRPTPADPFAAPKGLGGVNTPNAEVHLTTTFDGLHAVLAANRATSDSNSVDLWNGSRAMTSDDFSGLTRTGNEMLNNFHDQHDPALTDDGLTLYYAPFVDTQAKQLVMMATRPTVTGAFGTPSPVINSTEGDADPYISPDQTVLIFSSTRTGGRGGIDVYYTVRDSTADPWQNPVPVDDIDTASNEADTIASRDGCTIYFASDRDKGATVFAIYSATMN